MNPSKRKAITALNIKKTQDVVPTVSEKPVVVEQISEKPVFVEEKAVEIIETVQEVEKNEVAEKLPNGLIDLPQAQEEVKEEKELKEEESKKEDKPAKRTVNNTRFKKIVESVD